MLGYIKVGAAVPAARVANCRYNGEQITECIEKAAGDNVKLLVFPELAVCCYTCGDLFFQTRLISECEKTVALIAEKSAEHDIVLIVGAPVPVNGMLYNCAVVIHGGQILGIVPKAVLSEGGEFNETRWFKSGSEVEGKINSAYYCGCHVPFGKIIFKCLNYLHFSFAVEVCADMWSVLPPSGFYSLMGATVIVNPSASPVYAGKPAKRERIIRAQSEKYGCVYIYSASSIGESTADSVFDGHAVIAEQGEINVKSSRYTAENEIITSEADLEDVVSSRIKSCYFTGDTAHFSSYLQTVEFSFNNEDNTPPEVVLPKSPYVPKRHADIFFSEIFDIQTYALYKRLRHTGIKKTVIGVSGGLDSTLALLAVVNCCDKMGLPRENVIGITMPGLGTSETTRSNAVMIMKELKISMREIPIKDACEQHFKDIGHDMVTMDAAFENAQARERTQILMDVANMENGLVIGTGDMSELALGWATYNGDHMSMYGLNSGLPKTVVRALVSWLAEKEMFGYKVGELLKDILATPISPELLPAQNGKISQKTEDLVGPYELHDFFIYYAVHKGFSPEKTAFLAKRSFGEIYSETDILIWLGIFYKRFFSQQFKRSCSPDSPKILEFGLSQRTNLKMPSDVCGSIWDL